MMPSLLLARARGAAASRVLTRSLSSLPPFPRAADYPAVPPPPAQPANFVSASPFAELRGARHGARHRTVKHAGRVPSRDVPMSIARPPYARAVNAQQPEGYPEPELHDARSAAAMRAASAIAADVLAHVGALMVPGVSGDQIDDFVYRATLARGAYPSPLGYMGFPRSVCVSTNEVVCHGIPDASVLRAGDVVSVDVSVFIDGVHGDTCRTWIVGGDAAGDARARALVAETLAALDAAVAVCGPGVPISRIGDVIAPRAAAARCSIIDAFAGHGVGSVFHTQPIVRHALNESPYVMREGMTFTIEPIFAEGADSISLWADGWAVVTDDGGRGAQFEHTLLVTPHGVDVLTKWPDADR